MEVQEEGTVPVRPVSDILKEARWVRVDQEEGSGPVRGLDEMFSWVREVKLDQSGGRELMMLLLLKSRDCRAVSSEKLVGSCPVKMLSLTFRYVSELRVE